MTSSIRESTNTECGKDRERCPKEQSDILLIPRFPSASRRASRTSTSGPPFSTTVRARARARVEDVLLAAADRVLAPGQGRHLESGERVNDTVQGA